MEDYKINNKKPWANSNAEGWLVVFCGFWLHFAIGESFLWGDLVYMTEYFSHVDTSIVYPIGTIVIGFAAIFAIKLKSIWGLKVHLLINSASIVICMILLSFIRNFYGFVIVYLVMFSIPTGFLYVIPITCAWSYFPNKRGLVSGIIVAGFGIGPFLFGFVAKAVINPEGVADHFVDLEERIPKLFWILAGLMFFCLGMNCLFLKYKTAEPAPPAPAPEPVTASHKQGINKLGLSSDSEADIGLKKALLSGDEKEKDISATDIEKRPKLMNVIESKMAPAQVNNDCPTLWRGLFSRPFLHLAVISTCQAYYGQYMLNKYKLYALTFPALRDDSALTYIGSFALATNGAARFLWAHALDKLGFRAVYYSGLILQLVLSATITFVTDYLPLYGLYICLSLATMANLTGTFPAITSRVFGLKHGPSLYAFIFLAFAFSNIISFAVSIADVEYSITLWLAFGLTVFAGFNSIFLKSSYKDYKWD